MTVSHTKQKNRQEKEQFQSVTSHSHFAHSITDCWPLLEEAAAAEVAAASESLSARVEAIS